MCIQALKRDREEIYPIYLNIWAAVDSSRRRLEDFFQLAKHADLLNSIAPSFFSLVQSLLIGDAILALCRVTDSARYRSEERLTIKLLQETIDVPSPMDAVNRAITPLRILRNNWISHADLQRAVSGERAQVILAEVEAAATAILVWLKEFGEAAGLVTSEPVDQGTWDRAVSLTAALRDARAVHTAYIDLLSACRNRCPSAAAIDQQLTQHRAGWEDPPFSEGDWLTIRERVLEEGLSKVRNSIDADSSYMVILLQVQSSEHDITTNFTDRRVAGRINTEADRLRSELEQRNLRC